MERTRMVKVASTRDGFEARVIAARLGAEGIVWELQGNVDGPYPVGVVHVLVEAEAAEEARELLALAAEDLDDEDLDPLDRRSGMVAVVALVLVALLGLARIVALL